MNPVVLDEGLFLVLHSYEGGDPPRRLRVRADRIDGIQQDADFTQIYRLGGGSFLVVEGEAEILAMIRELRINHRAI